MRITEFAGVTIPGNQNISNLTRAALDATLRPTGAPQGDYDLYGTTSPWPSQTYDAEFMFTAVTYATLDALLAKVGTRGTLKQLLWDQSTSRQTEAKLISAELSTTVEDKFAGIQRCTCQFRAEPFWYATTATTVSFSSTASVNLTSANSNLGNARAIKYVVLTITTNLAGATTFTITPTAGTTAAIQYLTTTSGNLVINAGAHTVYVGATNSYANTSRAATQIPLLFLEPGNSVMTFSRSLSGNIVFRSCYK